MASEVLITLKSKMIKKKLEEKEMIFNLEIIDKDDTTTLAKKKKKSEL